MCVRAAVSELHGKLPFRADMSFTFEASLCAVSARLVGGSPVHLGCSWECGASEGSAFIAFAYVQGCPLQPLQTALVLRDEKT